MFDKKFPNRIKSLFGQRSDRRRRAESRTRPCRGAYPPRIEALEARLVLSTLLVTDIADTAGNAADVTLRYAVNNALNGDQIGFAGSLGGGTITLGSVLTINHDVSINGLGAANLAISGNNAVEVFSVSSGVTANISNLTIKNGHVSGSGGGISNSGTLTLSNDNITGNSATGGAGGIFNNAGGTLRLSNSTIAGNSAGGGGGIVNGTGSATNPATMTVSNSTISGNTQGSGGGILNTYNSKMTLNSDTISGNTTNGSGGGIYNQAYLTVSNSTISGNQANNGGGIFDTGSVTVSNSTIVGNHANSAGGGTNNYRGRASIVLINTIMTGNTNYAGANDAYNGFSGSNNLVGNATNLGALAGNGGPTQTVALLAGSNAIGAGLAVTSVSSDSGGSTINVANGATIAWTPGAYLIQSGSEQMLVTNVSGNTLTVVRGYNGTTVATHVGAGVFFDVDQRGYAINTSTTTPDIGAYQSQGTAPLTPTISSISPTSGPIAGGTAVTITGTNLSNATTVNFGPLAGTIVSNSGSVIVATTPALSAGTYDSTVTTVGWDTSATSAADQFATPTTAADAALTACALTPPIGTGTPTVTTYLSGLSVPDGLAFDAAGNLYVANSGSGVVNKVTPAGVVTPFATGIFQAAGMAFDAAGNLFVASYGSGILYKVTPAGVASPFASGFNGPSTVAFDANGNLYAPTLDGTVYKVTPTGSVSLFASGFTTSTGLAFDAAGNLYVGNQPLGTISKVTPAGVVSPFASGLSYVHGLGYFNGTLYAIDEGSNTVDKVSATGVVTPYATGLATPLGGIAFDAAGSLYVTNYGNNTVSKATPPLVEGQAFSNQTVFHFTDADPNGTASDYTAVVARGDGTSVTLTSTPSANGQIVAHIGLPNGGFDVQLSYTYAEELTNATFSVTVTDAGGSSTSASTSTFNVADAPLTATATPVTTAVYATAFSGQVATFSDANPNATLSDFPLANVTIQWGDGNSSNATSITQPGGVGTAFFVIGTHTYGQAGATANPLHVTITDVGGAVSNATSYTPTVGKASSTTTTVGAGPFTYTGSAQVGGSGTVTGAGTITGSATVTYSSNSNGTGMADQTDAGTYYVTAHYAGDVNHLGSDGAAVAVTIGQKAATVVANAKSKTYGDVNPALTATVGGTVNGDVLNYTLATIAGQFSNVGSVPITVTLGTNGNYLVTSTNDTLAIGQKAATVTADHKTKTYGDAIPTLTATVAGTVNGDTLNYTLATTAGQFSNVDNYAITISLGTNANYSVIATNNILTVNQAQLVATGLNVAPIAGAPFENGVVATFATACPTETASSYTATITWGDGTISAGTIALNTSTGLMQVSGSHTYADPRVDTISVQITNVPGNAMTATVGGTATVTTLGVSLDDQQARRIGFWDSNSGHLLINSLNGGSTSTALSNWLVTSFPNLYGSTAGSHNLTGKTNAQMFTFFDSLFAIHRDNPDVQVLATALNIYVTTSSLGGTAGQAYGFRVTPEGLGAVLFNVGQAGAAVGAANGTTVSVNQMMQAANQSAVGGVLYAATTSLRDPAEGLFEKVTRTQYEQTEEVGFWHRDQGQALIDSFNGGSTATALGNWLAATFSNLYGVNAGSHNLTGQTNAQVAAFFQTLWNKGDNSQDAQVLATALNVYATTLSLGGTAGQAYGFLVTNEGLGAVSFKVNRDGAAVGVANGTTLNVYQMLQAANRQAVNGVLSPGNSSQQDQREDLFERLNRAGEDD